MPKIGMQKIKPDSLKEMLNRTGIPRQELAQKLGLKTPSIFFKWIKNGELPADRYVTLHQLLEDASGSANPAAAGKSAIKLKSITGGPALDLTGISERTLVAELQRRGWDVTLKPIGGIASGGKGQ